VSWLLCHGALLKNHVNLYYRRSSSAFGDPIFEREEHLPCPKSVGIMSEVYGEDVMNEENVHKWCRLLNGGRRDVSSES
jgi:hypothetical protein